MGVTPAAGARSGDCGFGTCRRNLHLLAHGNLETLFDLCKNIVGRTVCAFGDAEVAPVVSTLQYWRHEYEDLIREAEAANLVYPEAVSARR